MEENGRIICLGLGKGSLFISLAKLNGDLLVKWEEQEAALMEANLLGINGLSTGFC